MSSDGFTKPNDFRRLANKISLPRLGVPFELHVLGKHARMMREELMQNLSLFSGPLAGSVLTCKVDNERRGTVKLRCRG